jgi:hypothetical protein
MRRRVASPVPPFDTVPFYVVEAAKRAFLARVRLIQLCLVERDPGPGSLDLAGAPPARRFV